MNELRSKLDAAEAELIAAERRYSSAALVAQENPKKKPELDAATATRSQAAQRVEELRAAITAAEERDETERAAAAEAAERERAAKLNVALQVLNQAGQQWDAVVDQLVTATAAIEDATEKLHELRPASGVYQQIDSARFHALIAIGYRLRGWIGNTPISPPMFDEERARLTHHLPKT